MSDPDALALARRASQAMHANDSAARALGMTIEAVSPGRATLSMRVRADMLNGHDVCHGGLLFALADTAFAHACNSYNQRSVAASCNIEFLRPARRDQTVIATAEERWRSGRTGVYDVSVHGDDGQLLALFRGKSFTLGESLVEPADE